MSMFDFQIGKETIDLNKLKGFIYKEEFAEEAKTNPILNTIFDKIDGIEINGVKCKKDGKIDETELAHLVKMLGMSGGADDKLSRRELKKMYGFWGLRELNLKDVANFIKTLETKLKAENRPIAEAKIAEEARLAKEEAKVEIFNNNYMTEALFNKYYKYDSNAQKFVLKEMDDEQKKEYDKDFCDSMLNELRTCSLKELSEKKGLMFKSDRYVQTISTDKHKIVFKRYYSVSDLLDGSCTKEQLERCGCVTYYNLNNENKEEVFDIFNINADDEKMQADYKLIDLFCQGVSGAEELIKKLLQDGDDIKLDIKCKMNEISNLPRIEEFFTEEDAELHTINNTSDHINLYNKLAKLIGEKECQILTDNDFVKKKGIKILKSIDQNVYLEDLNSLRRASEFFQFDDSKLNGKIDSWSSFSQSHFGNCWQVAAMQSLMLSNQGKDFINTTLIKESLDKKTVSINTALRTQAFDNKTVKSLPGILSEDSDKDAIALSRCIRSFEENKEDDYSGGFLTDFVKSIFGPEAEKLVEMSFGKEEIEPFLKNNINNINNHKYLIQLSFHGEIDNIEFLAKCIKKSPNQIDDVPKEISSNHAYTIHSIDQKGKNITLIDPNYTATITFPISKLPKYAKLEYGNIEILIKAYKEQEN